MANTTLPGPNCIIFSFSWITIDAFFPWICSTPKRSFYIIFEVGVGEEKTNNKKKKIKEFNFHSSSPRNEQKQSPSTPRIASSTRSVLARHTAETPPFLSVPVCTHSCPPAAWVLVCTAKCKQECSPCCDSRPQLLVDRALSLYTLSSERSGFGGVVRFVLVLLAVRTSALRPVSKAKFKSWIEKSLEQVPTGGTVQIAA